MDGSVIGCRPAGLKGGITIFGINQTDFGNLSPGNKITPKMSQEAIVSFMNKLPSGPITIRGGYFDFSVNFVNKISIGAIVPPADSTHPEGVCLSGNCRNGEGYLRYKSRDYYRGTFKDGKPVEGDFYTSATATRKRIPEPVTAVVNNATSADSTLADYLIDAVRVNGQFDQKFKRTFADVKNKTVYFEGGRKYVGELNGQIPNGRGQVHYSNLKIADPNISTAIVAPMILECEFTNGKFVKINRLRTEEFTGMFIEGFISAGSNKGVPFWYASNPTLNVWSYLDHQSKPVDEIRTIFRSKVGNSCRDGKFNGPGTWYCNQFGYSPIYGGEIHVFKMEDGFVSDSVELVLPHLNYRKKFSVARAPRLYLRLDLLEYYIELYYTTGKVPEGNWNTAMGYFVVKPPPPVPKVYKVSDAIQKIAESYKKNFIKEFGNKMKLVAEGAVLSDGFLGSGLTLGEYLDLGQSMGLLVFTLENAPVEVTSPKGKCLPEVTTTKEYPVQVQVFDCDFTQEQQFKGFFASNIKFSKPGTEMYYLLYKLGGN